MVITVALVALVTVLAGAAATIAMREYLTGRLDDEVLASAERASNGPPGPGPPGTGDVGLDAEPGRFGNQPPGTLVAFPAEGVGEVLSDQPGTGEVLSADALDRLATVPADGRVHVVSVDDLGDYRVAAVETNDDVLVTGLPTRALDDSVASLLSWEIVLAVAGTGLAAIAGTFLVRRQMRPLGDVAQTAHAVSQLPLEAGEIGRIDRVPERLTHPGSEVGQVATALNTLLAHVESSLTARHRSEQQVRQFVADASHELRTPLTTIAGYTELARRHRDASTMQTALTKVEEESRRMTALVEDLLLLARLDAGRPIASETIDLTRVLLEAVDDARVVGPEHRWHVDVPRGGRPVEVVGDPARLHQVVTNLLTNARKHTPSGTTVTVVVRSDGFDVRDDGPGFAPSLVEVAFERFTRGDESRERSGGAGLGLALVEAIVRAHGGRTEIRSVPGHTVVEVRLPT